MEKAYVFLADGFEEIEGLTVVDILRRAGADTQTVSVMGRKEITGSHRITLQADLVFEETSFEDGTLFVLPGGMPGTKHLGAHEGLTSLLKKAAAEGKTAARTAALSCDAGDRHCGAGRFWLSAVCFPAGQQRLS